MAFGKAFATRAEAKKHMKKLVDKDHSLSLDREFCIRKMDKRIHPRRKKLFHVGYYIDFINFA